MNFNKNVLKHNVFSTLRTQNAELFASNEAPRPVIRVRRGCAGREYAELIQAHASYLEPRKVPSCFGSWTSWVRLGAFQISRRSFLNSCHWRRQFITMGSCRIIWLHGRLLSIAAASGGCHQNLCCSCCNDMLPSVQAHLELSSRFRASRIICHLLV